MGSPELAAVRDFERGGTSKICRHNITQELAGGVTRDCPKQQTPHSAPPLPAPTPHVSQWFCNWNKSLKVLSQSMMVRNLKKLLERLTRQKCSTERQQLKLNEKPQRR